MIIRQMNKPNQVDKLVISTALNNFVEFNLNAKLLED